MTIAAAMAAGSWSLANPQDIANQATEIAHALAANILRGASNG